MDKNSKEYKAALVLREWAMTQFILEIQMFEEPVDQALFDLCAALEELFPELVAELEAQQGGDGVH